MPTVETVRGPVDTADLGATLMHEHVFVVSTEHVQNYGAGAWWNEEERIADAVEQLNELKGLGIDTIVDPTVWGLGRYIPRVQRVAEQTDINIIVATGLYTYDEIPHQYENRGPGLPLDLPTDPMVDDFTRDIRERHRRHRRQGGVPQVRRRGQGPHAGRRAQRARPARAVHRDTGAPITVHTSSPAQTGRLVLQVFREEGVDLTKVVIGHAGDSNDLDYLTELADAGCLLGMDRFGLDIYNPTADRVGTIVELAQRGYADRMVLAHDASCFIDYFPDPAARSAFQQVQPNWNFTHISNDVLPMLRERGSDRGPAPPDAGRHPPPLLRVTGPEFDEQGRPEPPVDGDETATLLGLPRLPARHPGLEVSRAWTRPACGPTVGASSMTLGGLLKHLALVEDSWFSRSLHGNEHAAPWDAVRLGRRPRLGVAHGRRGHPRAAASRCGRTPSRRSRDADRRGARRRRPGTRRPARLAATAERPACAGSWST